MFDNPASGVENKAAANTFEDQMFHIIRAFHVAEDAPTAESARGMSADIPRTF
ncbi:MAG: hypothetical protein ACLR5G_00740 [Eubacteriales bacterium]